MKIAKKVGMQINLIDDAGLVDLCYEPSCVVSLSLEALNKKYNDEIEKNNILNTNYNELISKYEILNNDFNKQIINHNNKINEYDEKIKNFIELTNKFSDVLKCLNN
jgi:predicted nuclease with TOPRIM domain